MKRKLINSLLLLALTAMPLVHISVISACNHGSKKLSPGILRKRIETMIEQLLDKDIRVHPHLYLEILSNLVADLAQYDKDMCALRDCLGTLLSRKECRAQAIFDSLKNLCPKKMLTVKLTTKIATYTLASNRQALFALIESEMSKETCMDISTAERYLFAQ